MQQLIANQAKQQQQQISPLYTMPPLIAEPRAAAPPTTTTAAATANALAVGLNLPQLTLEQIQQLLPQLLAQQQVLQMQQLQQHFQQQQQQILSQPMDLALQLLLAQQQQQQAQAQPPTTTMTPMMNAASAAALLLQRQQNELQAQQLKEYNKQLAKKQKQLKKNDDKIENVSFKSIMSQQIEGEPQGRGTQSLQEVILKLQNAATEKGNDEKKKVQVKIESKRNTFGAYRKEGSRFVSGRPCGVIGCKVLCEKSRSLVGVVQQCCEMHKREEAFNLKGREGVYRWCFYCHKPQLLEDFSHVSKSICTDKFELRKERRKMATKNKNNSRMAESQMVSEAQLAMQYATIEHMRKHYKPPSTTKTAAKPVAKATNAAALKNTKKPMADNNNDNDENAMRALCDIVEDEERRRASEESNENM